MATAKMAKIQAKIEKAKAKLAEQQRMVRELEHERTATENMEIVDIVRGLNIPLDTLATALQAIKAGTVPVPTVTSGQVDPKLAAPKKDKEDTEE